MKIRTGFVSNSSSSSFLVGVKTQKFEELPRVVEQSIDDETAFSIFGNVDKFVRSRSSLLDAFHRDDEVSLFEADGMQLAASLVDKGWTVGFGTMPMSGDGGSAKENELAHKREPIIKEDFELHWTYD